MERELRISVNLDNSAFDDDMESNEIGFILRTLADKIDADGKFHRYGYTIHDSNGNRVGRAFIVKDED